MSGSSSEYDEIRHAYDNAFHRWSHEEKSSAAEREYHRLRDELAHYILEHEKADESRLPPDRQAAVNAPGRDR